jgi:hypothetical protein
LVLVGLAKPLVMPLFLAMLFLLAGGKVEKICRVAFAGITEARVLAGREILRRMLVQWFRLVAQLAVRVLLAVSVLKVAPFPLAVVGVVRDRLAETLHLIKVETAVMGFLHLLPVRR